MAESLEVDTSELVTVREATRSLSRIVRELRSGEREKAVLMHHGKMVAVIRPIDAGEKP